MQGAETEERLTTREDCARVWRWLDIDSKISRSIGGEVLHALSCHLWPGTGVKSHLSLTAPSIFCASASSMMGWVGCVTSCEAVRSAH